MSFTDLLAAFTAAVEAGDGKALGRLFTPDGVYHDTFYGEFKGADAIADMIDNRFQRDARDFRWDMLDPVSDGRRGYARWLFSYTSRLEGAAGERVLFEGMSMFDLDGGRIAHYGEMFDSGVALAQVHFPGERIGKIVGRAAARLRERHAGSRHLAV